MNAINTTDAVLADGIYFDLPDQVYFADAALGSSDMKRLARNPYSFWHRSRFNANRPEDKDTPSKLFGRAAHKMILEGREAFEALYAPVSLSGATKEGKAERAAIAEAGKTPLPAADYERILVAGTLIANDPEIAKSFVGGRPEVSVFWTDTQDGVSIRKKARFDYLKVGAIVDLKSIRPNEDEDFDKHCEMELARRRYYVQAAHYRQGWETMATAIEAGAVFGDHDPAWLKAVVSFDRFFYFAWVFYQNDDLPLVHATLASPANRLFEYGRSMIDVANYNFRQNVERFGTSTPWIKPTVVAEYDCDSQPAWVWK